MARDNMHDNLRSLIGKLNDTCYNALEAAARLCQQRAQYEVDIEHLLLMLSEGPDTDLRRLLRYYDIDQAGFVRDLTYTLDRFKTGNTRTLVFSPRLLQLLTEAWSLASLDFGATRIRSAHLLLALLESRDLAPLARESSKELQRIAVQCPQTRKRRTGLRAVRKTSCHHRRLASRSRTARRLSSCSGRRRTAPRSVRRVDPAKLSP
jgi:ATP-dependent Clp protease ATP-binding subunit ClpA